MNQWLIDTDWPVYNRWMQSGIYLNPEPNFYCCTWITANFTCKIKTRTRFGCDLVCYGFIIIIISNELSKYQSLQIKHRLDVSYTIKWFPTLRLMDILYLESNDRNNISVHTIKRVLCLFSYYNSTTKNYDIQIYLPRFICHFLKF